MADFTLKLVLAQISRLSGSESQRVEKAMAKSRKMSDEEIGLARAMLEKGSRIVSAHHAKGLSDPPATLALSTVSVRPKRRVLSNCKVVPDCVWTGSAQGPPITLD